jgi:hypothetical protein
MRRVLMIVCCWLGLGVATPTGALDAGGPMPPVQGGAGVSAPGGDVNYVAIGVGRSTLVQRVRRSGGAVERYRLVRGDLGVAGVAWDGSTTGLSADGRTLVLANMIGRHIPRRTRIAVFDAARLRPRAKFSLPGYFAVDAISPTARWLYFIRYPSVQDISRYEVRAYDLRARRLLTEPVIDPREPDEEMRGLPLTRATSSDGRWAYTLYDGAGKEPFIHALDTEQRTAACIDLPGLAGTDVGLMRLALGDDGATLRVEERGEPVTLVDTRSFEVSSPAAAAQPRQPTRRPVAAADDGAVPWVLGALALALAGLAALMAVGRWRRQVRSVRA